MKLSLSEFQARLAGENRPCLVEFYSETSQDYHMLDPEMDALKEEFGENLSVFKVNADESPELVGAYSLEDFPTLMLFRNGDAVWRHTGLVMITNLLAAIDSKIGLGA